MPGLLTVSFLLVQHVILPPDVAKLCPKGRLLSEAEWRGLGVQQSRGWVHYALHRPEPNVLLFRRPLDAAAQNAAGNAPVAQVAL